MLINVPFTESFIDTRCNRADNGKARRLSQRTSNKDTRTLKWPVTYRFVAMGTLMAYTAFGATRITLAQSPEPLATIQVQSTGAPTPVRCFAFPPARWTRRLPHSKTLLTSTRASLTTAFARRRLRACGVYTDEQAGRPAARRFRCHLSIHRARRRHAATRGRKQFGKRRCR